MVKIITNEDELKKYVEEEVEWEKKSGYVTRMTLTKEQIEEWKAKGYFAHLKRELAGMHKMLFACTEMKEGRCSYYFVSPTPAMMERVTEMLRKMHSYGRKVPIARCNKRREEGYGFVDVRGTIKACNLF